MALRFNIVVTTRNFMDARREQVGHMDGYPSGGEVLVVSHNEVSKMHVSAPVQ